MSQPEERDPWAPPAEDGSPNRPQPGSGSDSAPDSAVGTAPEPAPDSTPASAPPPGGPGHSFDTTGRSLGDTGQPPAVDGRLAQRGPLLFAIAALLASFAFPPVGFAMCGFTIVWAVRARRRARSTGGSAPGSSVSLGLAAVGLVVPLVLLGVFFNQLTTYQSCMSGANTHEAKNDCRQALEDGLLTRLGQR